MSMAKAMHDVDRMARRGLSVDAIPAQGISRKTVEAIVAMARAESEPEPSVTMSEADMAANAARARVRFAEINVDAFIRANYREIEVRRSSWQPRGRRLIEEVAAQHGLTVLDMRSISRSKALVAARHEAMYRMAVETTLSLPAIGNLFGGMDHTTVIHGIRRHCERNRMPLPRGMTPDPARPQP